MALNIKNERVHDLAREAAFRTGRNQTSAIELALQKLLDELNSQDAESADEVRHQTIQTMQQLATGVDFDTADLYDESGLPR